MRQPPAAERYGSTGALMRAVLRRMLHCSEGRYRPKTPTAKVIFDHLDDADVSATMNSWIDSIAFGIIGLVHIFNPEMVLIGNVFQGKTNILSARFAKILNGAMEQFAKDLGGRRALGNNTLTACSAHVRISDRTFNRRI